MPGYGRLYCCGVRRIAALAALGAAAVLLLARAPIHGQPLPPAPKSAGGIDRNGGEYLYLRHCSECHGRNGKGTVIGFPLVGRPAGVITPDHVIDVLRTPLQMMPAFPRETISDDMAKLIAHHIAVLENRATGAPVPPLPETVTPVQSGPGPLPPAPVARPAEAKTYEMREFDSPCGAGAGIAVAPDGRVWYAGIDQHNLTLFDPKTETFTCWKVPTRNARPHGIGVDGDGLVWATLTGLPDNKIAMFDPATELFAEYYLPRKPEPLAYPHTLAFDVDQNVVFSLEYGGGIGRINRDTGKLQFFALPTPHARPAGIDVARNGHIWVAEFTGNKIADLDARSGRVTEYVHPGAAQDPGIGHLALDAKGNIWFSENEFGSIGTLDPRTKKWKSWRAPANGGSSSGIAALALDRHGFVWFSHAGGNYIGRFDPKTERFSVYPHLSANLNCRALDFAKDDSLWCIGSGAAKLMRLTTKRAGN